MIGWKILTKSVGQIYYNFKSAVKISGAISLLGFALTATLFYFLTGDFITQLSTIEPTGRGNLKEGYWSALALTGFIHIFGATWIAVSWHRFLLLGEINPSFLPALKGRHILSYIWRTFIIFLLIVLAMIIPVIIIAALSYAGFLPRGFIATGVPILSGIIAYVVLLRLSLVLPAVALDKPFSSSVSWKATKPVFGGIVFVSVVIIAISKLLDFITVFSANSIIAGHIWSFLSGWVMLMFSVSILTTLYGHLIEGRSLD